MSTGRLQKGNAVPVNDDLFATMKEQVATDVKEVPNNANRRGFSQTALVGAAALGAGLAAGFLAPQTAKAQESSGCSDVAGCPTCQGTCKGDVGIC